MIDNEAIAATALIGLGIGGIVTSVVMAKMGYGKSMVGAVSKATRRVVKSVTRRWKKT